MNPHVLLNGEIVPVSAAKVSVSDGGFLHGAGLFETMRAENGRVFRLESHMARIRRSIGKLLRPITRGELPSRVDFMELLERNGLSAARVRLTVTSGITITLDASDTAPEPTICATASTLSAPPTTAYENGVGVMVCDARCSATDPTAGHKTIGYLSRLMGLREAHRLGCMETVWFTTDNQLAEGSISNIFLVKERVLKTPPLDTPVLPGITREIVLDLAGQAGMKTRECALSIDDLLDADEVMLTNAIMRILPVIRVEKRDIGDGRVGPVARQLFDAYRSLVRTECGSS